MPKTLQPISGMPVLQILNEMKTEKGTAINLLKNLLADSVNGEACCTEKQENTLKVSMWDVANGLNPEGHNDTNQTEFRTRLEQLIIMANGFRIDCSNCLNRNCPNRDKNCPVQQEPRSK